MRRAIAGRTGSSRCSKPRRGNAPNPLPDDLRGPDTLATLKELTTPVAMAAALLKLPRLRKVPRGDGRTVILLPGYGAGETSMLPLATFLDAIGYRFRQWGMGINRGNVRAYVERMGHRVEAYAQTLAEPVTLIRLEPGRV